MCQISDAKFIFLFNEGKWEKENELITLLRITLISTTIITTYLAYIVKYD